jgi:hypothetical protein
MARLLVLFLAIGCTRAQKPVAREEGVPKPPAQALTPIQQIDTWLDGFHVMKNDPKHVAEVHHYCKVVDEDLIQCALYDRSAPDAVLVGVEYVISEHGFASLPKAEQAYWHPHNYEVLSGMLVAPGMPEGQEQALMKRMLNSYGKTWMTWPMGGPSQPMTSLPLGDPELAWSYNADGEAPDRLVSARNHRLGIDQDEIRAQRQVLVPDAHPQAGVNVMEKHFPTRRTIRGVKERYSGTGTK